MIACPIEAHVCLHAMLALDANRNQMLCAPPTMNHTQRLSYSAHDVRKKKDYARSRTRDEGQNSIMFPAMLAWTLQTFCT